MNPEHKKYILENAGKKSIKAMASEQAPSVSMTNWQAPVFIILIAALGFMVYANSLGGKFLYDDDKLIRDNVYIKSWSNIAKIFTKDIGSGAGTLYNFNFYRPIQMLLYMMTYSLWKLNTAGYHFANIMLHISVALTVYFFINLLFNNRTIAFFAGVFFVVHPIHTEAVSYISASADPLSTLFILLSFIFYIKNNTMPAVLCYAISCLSKEYSLILPVLLLLYHYVFKKEVRINKFIPMIGVTFVYIVLRSVFTFSISGAEVHTTFLQRVPGFFIAVTNYVRLMFLPFGLHMEYGAPTFSPFDPKAIAGIVILCFLLFYALSNLNKDRLLSFAILWFIVSIMPVSNLLPINAYMAEHWLYLPSLGFFLILAKMLNIFYANSRTFCVAIAVCLLAYYSVLTVRQNAYWRDPAVFYEMTLKYTPNNWRIYNNFGNVYLKNGNYEKAMEAYKTAIRLNPNLAGAHNDLGNLYGRLNKLEDAIAAYKKAIEIDPNFAGAYNNIGTIYYSMNMQEEAIKVLQKAISLDPNFADAYNNLGNSYAAIGEKEEAIKAYKKAVQINPAFDKAYNNLGTEYSDPNEAIRAYKKAIEINPSYAEAYYNLSKSYEAIGKSEEAAGCYKKAKSLDPNLP